MGLAAVHSTGPLGPLLGNDDLPSLRIVGNLLSGVMAACPPFGSGFVDVRHVADLHLHAMTSPVANEEQFFAVAGGSLRIIEVARILKTHLEERAEKVPSREVPLWLARPMTYINPQMRAIRSQLGYDFDSTSAKAQSVLGWKPRPIELTIEETSESLLAHRRKRTRTPAPVQDGACVRIPPCFS